MMLVGSCRPLHTCHVDPVVLLLVLVAMPPVLMAIAHVYAVFAQDVKQHYIVFLRPKAPVSKVTAEHARRYKLHVDHVFDSSVKGYSALVPLRRVRALRADRWVLRVEGREVVESNDRWVVG